MKDQPPIVSCSPEFFSTGILTIYVKTKKPQGSRTRISLDGSLIQNLNSDGSSRPITINQNIGKKLKIRTTVNDTVHGTNVLEVKYICKVNSTTCEIIPTLIHDLGELKIFEHSIILGEG